MTPFETSIYLEEAIAKAVTMVIEPVWAIGGISIQSEIEDSPLEIGLLDLKVDLFSTFLIGFGNFYA